MSGQYPGQSQEALAYLAANRAAPPAGPAPPLDQNALLQRSYQQALAQHRPPPDQVRFSQQPSSMQGAVAHQPSAGITPYTHLAGPDMDEWIQRSVIDPVMGPRHASPQPQRDALLQQATQGAHQYMQPHSPVDSSQRRGMFSGIMDCITWPWRWVQGLLGKPQQAAPSALYAQQRYSTYG